MSEETKLIPCPFCGCEKVVIESEEADDVWDCQWWACCEGCGSETSRFDTEDEAVVAWNRRTYPPATAAVLAEVADLLDGPDHCPMRDGRHVMTIGIADSEAFLREQGAK